MFEALKENSSATINANNVNYEDGPFFCAHCKEKVTLKKGLVVTHHFAHKPESKCPLANGESLIHILGKRSIYNQLKGHGKYKYLEMEKNLGNVIADVYVEYKDIALAVEIQKSNLDLKNLKHRTEEYNNLGIHILWLVPYVDKLKKDRYAPSVWEKWLNYLYGAVYYLNDQGDIFEVVYKNVFLRGRRKISKRYIKPIVSKPLILVEDFERSISKSEEIPECKIMKIRDFIKFDKDEYYYYYKYLKKLTPKERFLLYYGWFKAGYISDKKRHMLYTNNELPSPKTLKTVYNINRIPRNLLYKEGDLAV